MKKVYILIITVLWLILFLFAYKNYQFSTDAIWRIEQQRREHTNLFPFAAKFIHNKGSYFSYTVFENYLSYYSPSIFFCCNQPLILELVILIIFYGVTCKLFKATSEFAKIALYWILIYPLFLSLALMRPSLLSAFPVILPVSGILIYSLYRKLKSK